MARRPLDPVEFREACVALLVHWEEVGEPGEAVDDELALKWFQERFDAPDADPTTATLRFLATMDALEEPPLCEFVATAGDEHETLHTAVFESAALAPMGDDGHLDVAWIAQDVGPRIVEIETLERLLGG